MARACGVVPAARAFQRRGRGAEQPQERAPHALRLVEATVLPDLLLLCVPGGLGTAAAMEDPLYLAGLRRLGARARYLTSVCTGSLLLGAAGLLRGKRRESTWR